MATLVDADFVWMKHWVNSRPEIKVELYSWGLDKATLFTAMQAIENYMVSAFGTTPTNSIRGTIEAVTGATTATRAQYLFVVWVQWKLYNYLGSV